MGRVNFIRYTFISETTYRLEHVQTLSCDTKIKLAASGGHGNHQFWGEEFVPQAEDTETRKTFAFVFEAPGGHGRIVLVLSVTIPIKVYELLTKTAIIGLVQGLAPKILPAMIDELREIDMPTTSDGMVSRSVETVPDPTDSPELRRCKFTISGEAIEDKPGDIWFQFNISSNDLGKLPRADYEKSVHWTPKETYACEAGPMQPGGHA